MQEKLVKAISCFLNKTTAQKSKGLMTLPLIRLFSSFFLIIFSKLSTCRQTGHNGRNLQILSKNYGAFFLLNK